MAHLRPHFPRSSHVLSLLTATTVAAMLAPAGIANAQSPGGAGGVSGAGNLVVSRSVYIDNPSLGLYPFVFNNALQDGSFGVTSKIFLDLITPFGAPITSLEVPNSTQPGITPTSDQLVTSFASKSELALNLSTDGSVLTFMGYVAPVNALDVSNTNTPAVIDPTNPVTSAAYRAVAAIGTDGVLHLVATNAYSGNNGRAAIVNNTNGALTIYTAGNAGNGSNPQPTGVVLGAGAQIIPPVNAPVSAQTPGLPTPVGSFSVTQLGAKADKVGKDDNFRGLTIYNDVLYFTKGSGGNGVNTVYFLDTSGTACPNGVGLPMPGARLPEAPLAFDPATVATKGLPSNMCILRGFPSTLNAALTKTTTAYPFGIWFANAKTLYVADEGDGAYADAGLTNAGLQKWVFDDAAQSWKLAYVLQNGLGLGKTYHFPGDAAYPTGVNAATNLPWAPVTDGLRNITGRSENGLAVIWAVTSTVSGSGDQGADPNKLVAIADLLDNQDPNVAKFESFVTLKTAGFKEVLRGVSFAPGTSAESNTDRRK